MAPLCVGLASPVHRDTFLEKQRRGTCRSIDRDTHRALATAHQHEVRPVLVEPREKAVRSDEPPAGRSAFDDLERSTAAWDTQDLAAVGAEHDVVADETEIDGLAGN